MKIAIGADHAAYELKELIKEHLIKNGHEVVDTGTNSKESTDYPIYSKRVSNLVLSKEVDKGILICGTGIGIGIAANKVKGIRCAMVSESYSAQMAVEHNDANIISFGARVVGSEVAKQIVNTFLNSKFTETRHQRRINMIEDDE